jgi:MFS family permease
VTPKNRSIVGGLDVGSSRIRQALIVSLIDGSLCSVMTALTDTFGIAAAVRLSAPAMAIALLGSTPLLIGSVGQFFLPLFLKTTQTRKFYVVASVRTQATFLILTGLIGWLPSPYNVWGFLLAFVAFSSSGNLFAGIWTSWIRDCVPKKIRGRHFAWRNRIFSLVQFSCVVIAGVVSRHYSSQNSPWLLFAVIFFTASVFRFGSGQFLFWQYDPAPANLPSKSQVFRFKPSKRFLHFCVSVALLQGTTAMAGPFFNVWFLRDLKFDYLTFSLTTAGMVLGTILFLPYWGRLIDGIGITRVLRITGFLCALVPLPYLFTSSPVIVWMGNFFSGIAWGGFNIANLNYLMHLSEKEKSDNSIAFASAASAIATFAFGLIGGFLSTRLPTIFTWQLQTLFGTSLILRVCVVGGLFRLFARGEQNVGREAAALAKSAAT